MRKPGRRDGDDARPDRIDEPACAAGDVGAPADGGDADPCTPDAVPHDGVDLAGLTDGDDLCVDLDGFGDDFPDDDFLFDPLLSDEPIDLAAVRADDALIDALGGGDLDAARSLVDPDDPLIAMLAAWAASSRPEVPAPNAGRPALTVIAGTGDAAGTDIGAEIEDDDAGLDEAGSPSTVPAPVVALAGPGDGPTSEPAAESEADPDTTRVPAAAVDADPDTVRVPAATATPDAEPDTIRVPAAMFMPGPAPEPETVQLLAASVDTGPTTEPETVRLLAPAAVDNPADSPADGSSTSPRAPVVALLERARTLRRSRRIGGRPMPADHPLRRAAVAFVIAALGVSAAAATGGTAEPGDVGFSMTRVFFAERARSLEAAVVVEAGLTRARTFLEHRQPAMAARELAAVDAALPSVREQEGHNQLVDQQKVLAAAVAVTPSGPYDPVLTATPRTPEPKTSVLAEGAPDVTAPEAAAPDAAAPDAAAPGSSASDSSATDTSGDDAAAAGGTSDESSATSDASTSDSTDTDSTSTDSSTGGSTSSEAGRTSGDTSGSTSTEAGSTSGDTGTRSTGADTGTSGTSGTSGATGGTDTGSTSTGTTDTGTTGSTSTDPGTTGTGTTGTGATDPGPGGVGILSVPSGPADTASGTTPDTSTAPATTAPAAPTPPETGSGPAAGSDGSAPAAAAPPPVAAEETHAVGSVTVESADNAPADDAPPAKAIAPQPKRRIVVTTVPKPTPVGTATHPDAPAANDATPDATKDDTARRTAANHPDSGSNRSGSNRSGSNRSGSNRSGSGKGDSGAGSSGRSAPAKDKPADSGTGKDDSGTNKDDSGKGKGSGKGDDARPATVAGTHLSGASPIRTRSGDDSSVSPSR